MTYLFILLLTFAFADTAAHADAIAHQNGPIQDDQVYLYDDETSSYVEYPRTQTVVDSLLDVATRERSRNSGVSFNAARQALSVSKDIDYTEGIARAHNLIGIKYLDFGDHELAHRHYLQALSVENARNNSEGIARLLNNIAQIYVEQENYSEGSSYLRASMKKWKELGDDRRVLATTNNLGIIHRREKRYKKALDLFWDVANRSLEPEEPDSLMYTVAMLNIGTTYKDKESFRRASIHLHAARSYFERHSYTAHRVYADIVLGELYRDLGEYGKALEYSSHALKAARKEQFRERTKEALLLESEIYEKQGRQGLAFARFKRYHEVSDSLQNMQRGERIKELQARFDAEKKDREIDLLNKEAALQEAKIAQQDQLESFLIFSVLLLLTIVGLLIRANHQRRKNNQKLREGRLEIGKQNRELSKLNREKDEFMSIAAHDLRNPLSSINMAVDLINGVPDIDKETLREYTGIIKISSDRMRNLINSVLHIHSMDGQSADDEVKTLDANRIVDEAVHNFLKPAERKQITLQKNLTSSKTTFLGDSDNVLRIFENLISNAIKYSTPETTVTISTRAVGDKVRVAIADQGPGIREEDQQKLFCKFARLSNKPTGNESSTGLGLYIVKKITEAMGGRVWCESEPGEGSTFYVELPVPKAHKKPATHKSSTGRRRAGVK